MIPDNVEITPGLNVRHDEGLLFRVDDVRQSTTGYELSGELGGLVVNYTQLEQGKFPPGTALSKDEGEFRAYFTPENQSPVSTNLGNEAFVDSQTAPKSWHINPQRKAAARTIAEILKRGYTLLDEDLREILPHYGYSPKGPAHSSVGSTGFKKFLSSFGVELKLEWYKGKNIYFDNNLPVEETDIERTRSDVDSRNLPRR
jgi:hypothetical protein